MRVRTDDESRKKRIDPSHDQSLGHHHSHIPLHHTHHALHGGGIRHWVRPRLASVLGLGEELAFLEGRHHVGFARLEGGGGQDVCVGAEMDAADERALLAELCEGLLLGRRLEERHCVVAQDTGQDHDYGDGEEDPPAAISSVEKLAGGIRMADTHNRAGSLWMVCTTGWAIFAVEA